MSREENTKEIRRIASSNCIDIFGVADLKNIEGLRTYPRDLLKGYRYGISLGVSLDRYDAYDMEVEGDVAYRFLRGASALIAHRINKKGYRAAIPDLDDPVKWKGPLYFKSPLSMKAVANAAGL